MSAAAHTPGPWQVRQAGIRWAIEREGGSRVIARTERPHERSQADARLIAAAPDLLAACEETERHLLAVAHGAKLGAKELIAVVHAAIAKAKGGAA